MANLTFYDWFKSDRQYQDLNKTYASGGSLGINLIRLAMSPGDYPDPPVQSLNMQLILNQGQAVLDFGQGRFTSGSAGKIIVAPSQTHCDYHVTRDTELLCVDIPTQGLENYLSGLTGTSSSDFGPLHDTGFKDIFVQKLALKLWQEATDKSGFGELFVEHTGYTLLSALLTKAQRLRQSLVYQHGLSKRQVNQVANYIKDHLAESLSLEDLARVLSLQPWEITKAFKKTTGVPPYQYVRNLRIERAKELLQRSNSSLVDIALTVGFSSQSHFTTAFKQLENCTPAQYRRQVRTVAA